VRLALARRVLDIERSQLLQQHAADMRRDLMLDRWNMSGTRRTPIGRESTKGRISDRAVDLWMAMNRLPRCTCPRPMPVTRDPCANCAKWDDLHADLHVELKCKLWEWPCVVRRSPKAAGSTAEPGEDTIALMALLDEAVRRRSEKAPAALSPPP
jgi:hypothetical protein